MATTYDRTPNLDLNLYGDNDPADLRDGYNNSMNLIDTAVHGNTEAIALKANKIGRASCRERVLRLV